MELPLDSKFLVTDTMGNVKDHEVREFDGETFWIYFRSDLSSSVDNKFYIYGGQP